MRALVVLGSVLFVVGALAVWVKRVALDSGTWSDTSAKVLENQTVRDTLSTYLVGQLYANVDVTARIRDALPERAKPLAAPAAAGLQDAAQRFTSEALARPRVQQAWRLANEQANRRLVAFVEDDSKVMRSTNGTVTLDLRQILQQVGGDSGLVNRVQDRLPPDAGRIVLLRSDQLSTAQQAYASCASLPTSSCSSSCSSSRPRSGSLRIAVGPCARVPSACSRPAWSSSSRAGCWAIS